MTISGRSLFPSSFSSSGVGRLYHSEAEQLFEDEQSSENCANFCEAVLGCAELPEATAADPGLCHNLEILIFSSGG